MEAELGEMTREGGAPVRVAVVGAGLVGSPGGVSVGSKRDTGGRVRGSGGYPGDGACAGPVHQPGMFGRALMALRSSA